MFVRRLAVVALMIAGLAAITPECLAQSANIPAVRAGEILRGRFVQDRHLDGMVVPLHSEGSFVLVPDKGLIWRGEKPFPMSTVITPLGVLQRVGDEDTMRVPTAQAPVLGHFYDMLKAVLSGDWSAVERDFVVVRDGDARSWKIVLKPRHKDDALLGRIAQVALRGDQLINGVEIHQTNGDWENLAFLDQKISVDPLSADEAAFFAAAVR